MTISQITKGKSEPLAAYRAALDEAHKAAVALADRTVTPASVVDVWSGLEQCIRTMNENKASERYLTGLDKGKREAVDMVWKGWQDIGVSDWFQNSPAMYPSQEVITMSRYGWETALRQRHRVFASAADVYHAFRCLYDVFATKITKKIGGLQRHPGISPPHTWIDFWNGVIEWDGDTNSAGGHFVETPRRIRAALSKEVVCNTAIVGYHRAPDGDRYEVNIVYGGNSEPAKFYDDTADVMHRREPFVNPASSDNRQQWVKNVFQTNDSLEDIAAVFSFVSGTPMENIEFQGYTMLRRKQSPTHIMAAGETCVVTMGYNPQTRKNLIISCATPLSHPGVSFDIDQLKRAVYEHKKEKNKP